MDETEGRRVVGILNSTEDVIAILEDLLAGEGYATRAAYIPDFKRGRADLGAWLGELAPTAILYDIPPVTGFMLVDSLLAGEKGAFRSALSHLVLPAIALGTIPLAVIARMTRSSMLEVLREDYVRTARAKGAGRFRVVAIHALRNALIPVVTTIGLQVGTLLAGAILTETIFAWPGIGKWLVEAIHRRDYPAVQGGILMTATIIIAVNLVVDLLYGVINPRIRHR